MKQIIISETEDRPVQSSRKKSLGSGRTDPLFSAEVGSRLLLKKKHPCGSQSWRVLRVGADFKLECEGCGHQLMLSRFKLAPMVKQLLDSEKSQEPS